jgi:coenzyme PQQ synthesis protein D (PqqD)
MPTMLDLDNTVCWSTNQLSGQSSGSVVVMDIPSGKHFGFDEIGERIWRALEKPTRLGTLADELCRIYEGDGKAIARQMLDFVARLVDQGLLVVR